MTSWKSSTFNPGFGRKISVNGNCPLEICWSSRCLQGWLTGSDCICVRSEVIERWRCSGGREGRFGSSNWSQAKPPKFTVRSMVSKWSACGSSCTSRLLYESRIIWEVWSLDMSWMWDTTTHHRHIPWVRVAWMKLESRENSATSNPWKPTSFGWFFNPSGCNQTPGTTTYSCFEDLEGLFRFMVRDSRL